jgi:hypothetical protein
MNFNLNVIANCENVMGRHCSICDHPRRGEIDKALVAGVPYRAITGQKNITRSALLRHKKHHLPRSLIRARQAKETASANNLLADVCNLKRRAERIFRKAEKSGDDRIALAALREARGTVELLAKLAGELQDGPTINVLGSPQYQILQQTIITTLAPYPEARVAVAQALKELPDAG